MTTTRSVTRLPGKGRDGGGGGCGGEVSPRSTGVTAQGGPCVPGAVSVCECAESGAGGKLQPCPRPRAGSRSRSRSRSGPGVRSPGAAAGHGHRSARGGHASGAELWHRHKMVKAGTEARGVILRNGEDLAIPSQAAAFDGWLWLRLREMVAPGSGMASPHLTGWVAPGSAFPSPGMDSVRASAVTHERQTSHPSVRDAGLRDRGADPVLEASCSQLACELHPCVPSKSC